MVVLGHKMVNSKANHGSSVGSDHSDQHTMFDNKKHKAEVDTGAPKKAEDEDPVTTVDDDRVPDFFPSQGVVPTIQSTPIPIEMMPEGKTYSYSPKDSVKKVANPKGSSTHFISLHPTAAPSKSPHAVPSHTLSPTSAPTVRRKKQFDNGDQFRIIDSVIRDNVANGTMYPSSPPMEYFRDDAGNGSVPEPPIIPPPMNFSYPSTRMIASSNIVDSQMISNPISENPVILVLGVSLFAVMGAFFYKRFKVRQGYTPIPTSEPYDHPSMFDI
jgi:hypothetical protein